MRAYSSLKCRVDHCFRETLLPGIKNSCCVVLSREVLHRLHQGLSELNFYIFFFQCI